MAALAVPPAADPAEAALDEVFAALADPVRRAILKRLDGAELKVSELAAPFAISLQAVSKHIQVLVRAGLVTQERLPRTGLAGRRGMSDFVTSPAMAFPPQYSLLYWTPPKNFSPCRSKRK